jgi:acyl-CoA dehydrogenase
MSEMNEMIIESATKIMEKFSTKEVVNDAENGVWASELWNCLNQNGMLSVGVVEELGGSGGDIEDALSILRLAGKYSAPIPLAETYIANWILSEHGMDVSNKILTIAFKKEMQPFSFKREVDGWRVTGHATHVPWARFAESLLVFGETDEGPILSLIDLARAEIIHGKNMAGEARDQVIFDRVFLDECKIISIDRDNMERRVLYSGALARTVMMAGALEKILEITINHVKERSQFGRPIHRFQAVQHHISALAGESASAGIAANYAINACMKNLFSKEVALAKIRVNEAAGKGTPIAHQVLAAIGFTYEHTLHHSTRRLWSWRDEFGTETDWEEVITEELLKLEKDGLWAMVTGVKNSTIKEGIK